MFACRRIDAHVSRLHIRATGPEGAKCSPDLINMLCIPLMRSVVCKVIRCRCRGASPICETDQGLVTYARLFMGWSHPQNFLGAGHISKTVQGLVTSARLFRGWSHLCDCSGAGHIWETVQGLVITSRLSKLNNMYMFVVDDTAAAFSLTAGTVDVTQLALLTSQRVPLTSPP